MSGIEGVEREDYDECEAGVGADLGPQALGLSIVRALTRDIVSVE